MKTAITKKLRAGTAFVCSLAVVAAAAAVGFPQTEVQASINNPAETDSTEHYYVPATLYDYKYDTEVNPSYRYTYSQKWYEDKLGGDRWQNGSQVPFENINRAISDYYKTNHASDKWPGLYFGNFWGSSSDCWKLEEKQYTYGLVNNSQQTKYYDTTEGYKNFWVFANNAPKAYDGYTAVQGLVDYTLTGGGNISQNGVALPQFDDTFINSTPYAEKYEVGNGFPFNKGSNGYYYFNSLTDYNRRYDYTTGNFVVENGNYTKNYRSDNGITSGERGFYPFNQKAFEDADRKDVNYGFGMRLDFTFSINSNGMTGNDETIFEFSGDDDVWVFIDNKLVLDLGGDHARVGGKINFCTGSVEVYDKYIDTPIWNPKYDVSNPGATNARADACDNYSTTLIAKLNNNLKGDGEHTMTVFYMERGMFESNLYIRFNFVPTDVKPPTSNQNQLIVRERTEFEGVNSGLLSYTKKAADADTFNYSISTTSTEAATTNPNSFPVYNNINRKNGEAYGGAEANKTVLSNDTGSVSIPAYDESVSEGEGSEHYIYFQGLGNMQLSSYKYDRYYAYFWDGNGKKRWVQAEKVTYYDDNDTEKTDDKVVKFEVPKLNGSYASKVLFAIMSSGNEKNPSFDNVQKANNDSIHPLKTGDQSFDWDSKWFFEGDEEGGNSNEKWSAPSDSKYSKGGVIHHNAVPRVDWNDHFDPSSHSLNKGVAFELIDPFADSTEKLTGITHSDSSFMLLYGETAIFDKQFNKHSSLKNDVFTIEQKANTYSHSSDIQTEGSLSTNIDKYHQNEYKENATTTTGIYTASGTARPVSDYYDTEIITTDVDGIDLSDYTDKNYTVTGTKAVFAFRNNTSTDSDDFSEGEKAVKITETFVNTVKTNKIKIKKLLASGTDSQSFKFKITFTDVFGASGVDVAEADYKNIEYSIGGNTTQPKKLSDDGTLTIKAGETAWITGIPVGTKYTVTEIYEGTGYTLPTITNGGTGTVSTTKDTDSTVSVTNNPDTNVDKLKLKITKRWINADEGLGAGGLDSETLKVLIQRKAKSETAWTDYDTITLTKTNQTSAPSGETTDYVWTYTATDVTLLKQKAANDPYTYRVQEFSQDGSALLLNDGALYTPHCTVQYFTGTQNADDFNANDIIPFSIVNTFDIPASIPKAGAEGTGKIIVFGITAITLAGAALMIYKKKIEDGYIIKKGRYMK